MRKQNFLRVHEFCEKYELSVNSIGSSVCQGQFPVGAFKKEGKFLFLDENFFIFKKEAQRRLVNRAHANYFLLSETMSDFEMARNMREVSGVGSVGSWNFFLNNTLFMLQSEKITRAALDRKMYLFLRFSSWWLQRMRRDERRD